MSRPPTYRRKTDRNHTIIRDGLRQIMGHDAVNDTSAIGNGFPDLVVKYAGLTRFVEVKWPGEKQTPAEIRFQSYLPPDAYIIAEQIEDVLHAFGLSD